MYNRTFRNFIMMFKYHESNSFVIIDILLLTLIDTIQTTSITIKLFYEIKAA